MILMKLPQPSEFARHWSLDPGVVFLNHGSFGACPIPVLEKQTAYRAMLETEPIRFVIREMEELYERSRLAVARFVHADPDGLVFVPNATAGVNTVFRSLRFNPGDEILYTNHIYGACKKLLEYIAATTGAVLVEAEYGFPIASPGMITEAVLSKVTPRTRIALIDHITSATALIHPVEEIVRELEERGIDTMIDGAHAPGSIPLDITRIGAAYYTGNCHKWLCTPKGTAILHVRDDRRKEIVPLVVSHAGHLAEPFAERFFWPGTWDPSGVLSVFDAIEWLDSLLPGGWPAVIRRNHALCLESRKLICDRLGIGLPCPDEMIATMATFPLPPAEVFAPIGYKGTEPLQDKLYNDYAIEIPVWNWSSPPSRLTRIAVQLYNSPEQFRYLAEALAAIV